MEKVAKVAIIGSGFGMYGLLPAFDAIKECRVISVCMEKSERLQTYWKNRNPDKIYADWKEMLKQEKPDAVAIAVPPRVQYQIATYALNHHIAVFAEKPLTASFNDSLKLFKLAQKTKLPNMIDFIFPEITEFVKAKKVLSENIIGKINHLTMEWNFLSYDLRNAITSWKTDTKEGGGALSFFFSHVFYYLEYFMGEINKLECSLSSSKKSLNKGDSLVGMVATFKNGGIGIFHMDISYMGKPRHSIKFFGEKGSLLLRNNSNNIVDNFELTIENQKGIKKIKINKLPRLSYLNLDPRVKAVKPLAQKFINWCNQGTPAKPDFEEGLRVQKLIEMARISNKKLQKK